MRNRIRKNILASIKGVILILIGVFTTLEPVDMLVNRIDAEFLLSRLLGILFILMGFGHIVLPGLINRVFFK